MRIAIFSDVHGNAIALDAVLADVERAGAVDGYWFIGDAASQGFDPAGCVQRISALPNLTKVRGNTDRLATTEEHMIDEKLVQQANENFAQVQAGSRFVANFFWTRGAVTATGGYPWLSSLPVEERVTLPDGTRVLLVHASPGTDEGAGITERQSDDELVAILGAADADLVIVGHTHKPLDRSAGGVRAWNLGSVSNPATEDKRAMWTLLEADDAGHALTRQYAEYDIPAVLAKLDEVHQPAAAVIRKAWA